ncbi:DUF4870 domain-containing protein [Shewanella sp. D64]|uniref:DUF4870 domain-containing protein n=1 Tax=unclassified Shewanella TaxID=196818 RepID=UPI0022BA593A|nr:MULTISPECIES: DUF4870 domain-containing protein [unclassified Shewanella]MEC4726250.1 DUF4870 domain-containing protein [Shewanella sp. D64]MEC4738262.1 DUF4870 domain-containing protein [Shewanella sp. E94]WBJ98313.1 DUF4870 domain-containing protein [Shewanella sp. MTB7]
MGIAVSVSSFAGYFIPFGSILGPLIVWLTKRDEMPFVDECGRNCLNFKLSLMIYMLISAILMLVGIGFILIGLLAIADIVFTIIASIKASEGISYRYPMSIKFLKPPS